MSMIADSTAPPIDGRQHSMKRSLRTTPPSPDRRKERYGERPLSNDSTRGFGKRESNEKETMALPVGQRVDKYGKTVIDFQKMSTAATFRLRLKNHFLAMIGEYVGTVLFTFFAFAGAQVANIPSTSVTSTTTSTVGGATGTTQTSSPNTSSILFISLSFGFSLTVNAWVFFRISGGLFNPAVSLGLALVRVITPTRAALLTVSQCLGAISGAALIQCLLPGPLYITTRLTDGMSHVRGLFLEMFLTAMLMLTILLLAAEKSKTTFLAPVGIGLSLFITQLAGVYWTGGGVNPARSLGPDVVVGSFPVYAWIYYVGPFLGAMLAAGFYLLMKFMHYETVVPGQDADSDGKTLPLDAAQGPGLTDYNDAALAPGEHDMAAHVASDPADRFEERRRRAKRQNTGTALGSAF